MKKNSLDEIVKVGGWVVSVIVATVSVVLWIQSQGNDRYYPKLAGEALERQLARIEQNMDSIESQNIEIIRVLGRIEGDRDAK